MGFASLALFLILLAGCAPASQPTYFRPPTPYVPPTATLVLPTATPAPTKTVQPGEPTPAVVCQDNLKFLSDVTIPDGTEVEANATMDKVWEVENNGNCNWGEGYRIRLIAGQDLNAQTEQALYPARSGTRAILRLVFKAPGDPGVYKSAWQAFDPQGEPFGDPFFIMIEVK